MTRFFTTLTLTAILLALIPQNASGAAPQAPAVNTGNSSIVCKVMEVLDDGRLSVRAFIFHQRDKADGPRLGSLLSAHSGQLMVLETAGGQRYQATVFRVKSAFGRGLVMIPAGKFKLALHDEFTLRLPAPTGKN